MIKYPIVLRNKNKCQTCFNNIESKKAKKCMNIPLIVDIKEHSTEKFLKKIYSLIMINHLLSLDVLMLNLHCF